MIYKITSPASDEEYYLEHSNYYDIRKMYADYYVMVVTSRMENKQPYLELDFKETYDWEDVIRWRTERDVLVNKLLKDNKAGSVVELFVKKFLVEEVGMRLVETVEEVVL